MGKQWLPGLDYVTDPGTKTHAYCMRCGIRTEWIHARRAVSQMQLHLTLMHGTDHSAEFRLPFPRQAPIL